MDADLYSTRVANVTTAGSQSTSGGTKSATQPVDEAKSIDSSGGTKSQPHNEDYSSLTSQTAGQGETNTPAKGIDSSLPFLVAGSQIPSLSGDDKNASASLWAKGDDQQRGQVGQEASGLLQGETHLETPAAYPTSLLNSAKLIERIGEAELRVGIRAGEFGSVDVRTSMVRNELTAEISVERGELGRVLAAELPSLHNRLAENGVPVTHVTLQNHIGGQSSASEQQKPREEQRVYTTNPAGGREETVMPALVALDGPSSVSRLDIHM
jgi:flagellar hook-length control protein FliK